MPVADSGFSRGAPTYYYRPQRSCGQGNIFTRVCHSFCSQGGVCLNACWDNTTPPSGHILPGADTPPRTRHPPGTSPPGKQTPAYCLRAVGMHPTGMHSCFANFFADNCMKMKEYDRGRGGGGHSLRPLGSTTVSIALQKVDSLQSCRSIGNVHHLRLSSF